MKAFVLCGGKGTRLRPYTYNIPKPMLTLGKRPILEFVVDNLKRSGIKEQIFTIGYLGDKIEGHFGNGERFGVDIAYLKEEKEMNTAGSIFPGKDAVKETFAVVMGDHLTTVNLRDMAEFHKRMGGIATIGLKRHGTPIEYGIAEVEDEKVVGFKEKPTIENLINAGIYIFEPEIFEYIEVGKDFAKDVFPAILKDGKKINSYTFDEYWVDIGRLHDYENLNQTISIVDLVLHERDRK